MDNETSEAAFVRDVVSQMDFDALISQFLLDPLLGQEVEIPQAYQDKVSEFKFTYAKLHGEMLRLKIQAMNPRREYSTASISNAEAEPVQTPAIQLPVTLQASKSLAVFSAQSSFTRFVQRINQPLEEMSPTCVLAESGAIQAPPQQGRDVRLDFDNYTIPELKMALQQMGQRYKGQRAAIDYLKDQNQRFGRVPDIALTAFELMTPERKNDLEFRLERAIQESEFYQSIISFVPVDIAHIHQAVRRAGITISLPFLEEYLICMGVQFCRGERKIGEMRPQNPNNELTLSENIRRKK